MSIETIEFKVAQEDSAATARVAVPTDASFTGGIQGLKWRRSGLS